MYIWNRTTLLQYVFIGIIIAQTGSLIGNSYLVLADNKVNQVDKKHQSDKAEFLNESVKKRVVGLASEKLTSYNYDALIKEHSSRDLTQFKNVTDIQVKGFILNNMPMKHIKYNLNKNKTRQTSAENAKNRLKEMLKLFVFLYLILAMPLWCTKGWCCCCLSCKFFKPNKIIEDAKVYLDSNPPGVLRHRGGVIYYEPTDNERDCYERLGHLIRTI